MVNIKTRYITVLVVFILAACAAQWAASRPVTVRGSADLASFPMELSQWKGNEVPLTEDVLKVLNADTHISRNYVSEGTESPVGMLIIYRKYGRRDFAHRPEMCYPAAGWEIVEKGVTTLPYAGRDIDVIKVVAQKGTDRDVILYWFASGKRTESSFVKQQAMMAMDRLRAEKFGWAFIRLNSPVYDSDERTLDDMRKFMEISSGYLVDSLTSISELVGKEDH